MEPMDFSWALRMLKAGKKVARGGWNGKGMHVEMCNGKDYSISMIEPFFVIKNVKNSFNTWVPSVSDILAEDWDTVEA